MSSRPQMSRRAVPRTDRGDSGVYSAQPDPSARCDLWPFPPELFGGRSSAIVLIGVQCACTVAATLHLHCTKAAEPQPYPAL